jgi:thymidylate synthase
MNPLDKQYTALLQDILDNGVTKQDRTGTGTLSVFGRQIRHKMSEGFPLLTTKKIHFKSVVTELLWFLRGGTNIKYLVDNNCHIWDGDCHQSYLKNWKPQPAVETQSYLIEQEYVNDRPLPKDMFIHCIKTDDEFAKKWGELGPIYGKQWREWKQFIPYNVTEENCQVAVKVTDQIANLINDLKTNPDSRRLMVNAWNVGELDQMVLPPCHYGFQCFTRVLSLDERRELVTQEMFNQIYNGGGPDTLSHSEINQWNVPTRAISLMWNQRSVDTFLGLPFNIASYGLLLEIIAKEVNMIPDELIGNLGDVHLYLNHIEQAKEQIGREYTHKERKRMLEDAMTEDIYNEAVANLMPFGGGMSEYYDAYKIPTHTREPYPLPKLFFKYEKETYVNDYELDGFILKDYQSHPTIKAPLSN